MLFYSLQLSQRGHMGKTKCQLCLCITHQGFRFLRPTPLPSVSPPLLSLSPTPSQRVSVSVGVTTAARDTSACPHLSPVSSLLQCQIVPPRMVTMSVLSYSVFLLSVAMRLCAVAPVFLPYAHFFPPSCAEPSLSLHSAGSST